MSRQAYQVIARRWRPKQFSELVGQDHIVRTLGNAIKQNRIAHAYLFVGPRGTGKTTSARLFAKSLNWEDGPSLEVPESSEIGNSIMEGRCLDVIEIDGASNNSVDQVRDLRDECQYAPSQCRFKIYVIDEVHMLSQQAFNALLKTLEEPPEHVKFIFATTESHKVLPTIISRCQRFEFRSISADLITGKLQEICEAESIDVEKSALEVVSRMAMGGMRDAQSILDQMISFCGKKITQADVLEVYGLVSHDRIQSFSNFILDGNYDQIIRLSDSLSEEGLDFYRALLDLSENFRNILLELLRNKETNLNSSPEQCVRILDVLRNGEDLVRMGLSEKTNFEVTLFRAVEAGRTRSIDQVIRKISGMIPNEKKNNSLKTEIISSPSDSPTSDSVIHREISSQKKGIEVSFDENNSVTDELTDQVDFEVTSQNINLNEEKSDDSEDKELTNQSSRQVVDQEKIKEKIEKLPDGLRGILENRFKAEFVSVEKIDDTKLI